MHKNHTYPKKRGTIYRRLCSMLLLLITFTILSSLVIHRQGTIGEPYPLTKINYSTTGDEQWSLTLVNKANPIKANIQIDVTQLSNGVVVDRRIYPYLQWMFDAARNDGVYPVVVSGYRTAEEQDALYKKKVAWYEEEGFSYEDAQKEAALWVALPGTSEHQLGLAIDINGDGKHSEGKEVYRWLKDNAHLYGFILRYPRNKTHLTGISYEPWHYRYVGIKEAHEIYKEGLCLEEYLTR